MFTCGQRRLGDPISCQNDRKILHGGLPQSGEIVSKYSNIWIDLRHDNALNSADPDGSWPTASGATVRGSLGGVGLRRPSQQPVSLAASIST